MLRTAEVRIFFFANSYEVRISDPDGHPDRSKLGLWAFSADEKSMTSDLRMTQMSMKSVFVTYPTYLGTSTPRIFVTEELRQGKN